MKAMHLDRVCAVTGASGFIGQHLVRRLHECADSVFAWDLPEVDLLDQDAVRDATARHRPGLIFHLAAVGVQSASAHDPSVIGANVRMVANVIEAAPEGAAIIIAGTMSEYGTSGKWRETDRCAPQTAYGAAKCAVSHYALAYGPARGISVCVARLFGVYGPGEGQNRLFPMLLQRLRRGEPVPLSDGEQRRDFIHVEDACEGFVRLAATPALGADIVNVGTGEAVRIRDAASWIATALGADLELLRFGARHRSPGDADLLVADVSKLESTLGWRPKQRLRPGLDVSTLFGRPVDGRERQ